LALALSSCGAADYHYVKNSDAQLYFKVPAEWARVDQKSLDAAEINGVDPSSQTAKMLDDLTWSIAYDAASDPKTDHIFGGAVAEPVVYAKVIDLLEQQQGGLSLDAMRNFLLPVTAEARESARGEGRLLPGFELLGDAVLTPGDGLRGVRDIFSYQVQGQQQTFDQTVLANEKLTKVYLLLVRCSAACYTDRRDELDDVARSFTVRG
jgi:hypothetical protein